MGISINKQILFQQIIKNNPSLSVGDLELMNEGAPNSWTILNKKDQEVWKIIKSTNHKLDDYLLEKEALDRIPEKSGVVKYVRKGSLEISENNGKRERFAYLVFPYISDSIPLDKLIRDRRQASKMFSDTEIISIGKQLVKIVSNLYKVDVVHQDIKPGNILINKSGDLLVIDLGIAMFVDKDLGEIKKMKGPYAYLSPEKLDLIADLSEFNKRRLSFTSDLFSVGMILFELATFKKLPDLMQPGEIRTAYLRLLELGLPKSLLDVVSCLLDQNILERQKRVGIQYQEVWLDEKIEGGIRLWLQHASNGIKYLDQIIQEHVFKTDWGIIYSADQMQGEKNIQKYLSRTATVKSKSGKVAIDPCTYRLRFSDEHHSYLVNRDFWQVVSQGLFLNQSLVVRGQKFVEQVLSFQEKFESDIFISPYFIIENLDDRWIDANFSSFNLAHTISVKKGYSEQLYFGLFLSENFILNEKAVDEVITQVILNKKIKNVYLRLESVRNNSEPNEDPVYLLSVKRIIESLSKYKNVLLGFADVEVLGWLGSGLSEVGINPDYEKRKCQVINIMTKAKRNIPTPDKKMRYFAQVLLNDVFSQDELRSKQAISLGSDRVFGCGCPFCFVSGKDMRLDSDQVRKHFIWNFEKLILQMNGKSLNLRKKYFGELLQLSSNGYSYLESDCNMVFNKSSDSSFIPIWRSTILS